MKMVSDLVLKHNYNIDHMYYNSKPDIFGQNDVSKQRDRPINTAIEQFKINEFSYNQALHELGIKQLDAQGNTTKKFTIEPEKIIDWKYVAEYANFLDGIYEETKNTMSKKSSVENYDAVVSYFESVNKGETSAKQESFFAKIEEERGNPSSLSLRNQSTLLKDIKNEKDFYDAIHRNNRLRDQCKVLAQAAPQEM